MFYLDFAVQDDILRSKSEHYTIDSMNRCVKVTTGQSGATIHSVAFKSQYSNSINNYLLKADSYVPLGASIKYYVSNDLNNYYPISVNHSIPLQLDVYHENVYIKVELIPNMRGESPLLFSICLFCIDQVIDKNLTLLTPNLTKAPIDKSLDGDILMVYNTDGRLEEVKRVDATQSIKLMWDTESSLEAIVNTEILSKKTVQLIRDSAGILKIIRTTTEEI